jgi:hypothetical protein
MWRPVAVNVIGMLGVACSSKQPWLHAATKAGPHTPWGFRGVYPAIRPRWVEAGSWCDRAARQRPACACRTPAICGFLPREKLPLSARLCQLRRSCQLSGSHYMTTKHRILTTSFASVYPLYVAKAERKGRKKSEVDAIICWLTSYKQRELEVQLKEQKDFETFFKEAPQLNPSRILIKGVVCGVRVEDIQEPMMREIRFLDKLVDELAKGKAMEKILRA